MPDPVDATLPADRDLASTWPALMRETRALLNALIGGTIVATDPATGKTASIQFKITGQDDDGNDIWGFSFTPIT